MSSNLNLDLDLKLTAVKQGFLRIDFDMLVTVYAIILHL
jgi:hypothetical protein